MRLRVRTLLGAVLLLAVFGGLTWGLRQVFTTRFPGGNDLYPRWSAGCEWLRHGVDPYSTQATLAIQEGIYGRPALAGEDQVAFAYPIFTIVVLWPLCLTSEFATAHALAMTALIGGLVLTAVFARRATGWAASGGLWIWTVFWIVVMYPSARAVLLGQLAVVVALAQVGALAAVRARRDGLAGAALAFSLIKPQMALLLVPWLLFWGAVNRRWRLLAGFAATGGLLTLVPLFWLPSWPAGWIGQLRLYSSYTEFGSLTWILTTYLLRTPPPVEAVVTALLLGWLAVAWWRARREPFESMLWTTALTLVMTHFISPRTATTHFGPLLVPAFMFFRLVGGPDGSRRKDLIALVTAGTALASWLLFALTVQGRQESAWNYVPIPLILLGTLLVMKRPWARLVRETG